MKVTNVLLYVKGIFLATYDKWRLHDYGDLSKMCAKTCGNKQRSLKLSPSNDTLEFVAMDILWPLLKTFYYNQFVLEVTSRN